MFNTRIDHFHILLKEGGQLENEELVCLIQQGKNVTENYGLLYQQNEGLIRKICQPLSEFCELEDLMQEGFFGIVDAVEHFDSSLGNKFMTYASYRIRKHCIRYVQDKSRTRRIPVHLQEAINKYKKYFAEHNGQVDEETIKKELNLTQDQYNTIIEAMVNDDCISLDSVIPSSDDNLTVADTVASEEDLEEDVLKRVLAEDLWKVIEGLEGRPKEVILKRYKEEQEQTKVAEDLGLSSQRISQIERTTLKELSRKKQIRDIAKEFDFGSMAFRGGLQSFKEHGNTSVIERMVIRKMELEERKNHEEL